MLNKYDPDVIMVTDMINFTAIKNNGEAQHLVSTSPETTEALGAKLGEIIAEDSSPAFIALFGDLGAGKTAFVRGLASILSPGSIVRSPTYSIVNEYRRGPLPLYHFDLYRIEDEDDLYSIGYYDYIESGICVTEWSERAESELPKPRWEVKIVGSADLDRSISITYLP